jgi:hypothetical protein
MWVTAMAALRFGFQLSYVFFILLIIATVLLYEPLELSHEWLAAMLVPATIMALAAFVALPLYDWLHMPTGEKHLIQPLYRAYSVVLVLVMLAAPFTLAVLVLTVPDAFSVAILIATVALFALNNVMLLLVSQANDDLERP